MGLGGRPGHRLLDHDVLAGQDRPPGELEVRRHGRRQHHGAHVGVGQHVVVARREPGLRIGGRVRRAGLGVGVAAPAQVGFGQRAEVAQQVLAPPAQADHADGHALAHSFTTLPSAAGTAFRKSITSWRPLGHPGVVEAGVGGHHAHDVGRLQELVGERRGGEVELLLGQRGHERVVIGHVGAAVAQKPDQLERRRLAQVADVALVRHAQHEHGAPGDRLAVAVQGPRDALGAVIGHVLVHLSGQLDELGREVELARLPGQVERVDRQAVPTQAGARLERHEPVGLRRRGRNHLPHVQPHAVAQHRELVHERDVDRAEDVLEQLGQLGRVARADRDEVLDALPVERQGPLEAGGREPADDLRRRADGEVGAARVDPLRRHRQVEVAPRDQAVALEERPQHLAGRARVGGRLEHDELPGVHVGGDPAGGVREDAEVGLAVARKRRRQADQHGLGGGDGRVVGGGLQPARGDELRQQRPRHVLDVALAAADRLDLARVRFDAHHGAAGAGELDGERQPHVAGADDGDGCGHGRQDAIGAARRRTRQPRRCGWPRRPRRRAAGGPPAARGRAAPP